MWKQEKSNMYSFIPSGQNDHQGNMSYMNPNRRFTHTSPDSPSTSEQNGLKRQQQKNSNSFLMELVNASTALGSNTANLLNATGNNGTIMLPTITTIASTIPTQSSGLFCNANSLAAPLFTLGANSMISSTTNISPSSLSCPPKYRFVVRLCIAHDPPCLSSQSTDCHFVILKKPWTLWPTSVAIRPGHLGHVWLADSRRSCRGHTDPCLSKRN